MLSVMVVHDHVDAAVPIPHHSMAAPTVVDRAYRHSFATETDVKLEVGAFLFFFLLNN